jgi:3-hydroxymyristoyl/3-hydroxydecanoyl-(acyl carrier protein) dehydratase
MNCTQPDRIQFGLVLSNHRQTLDLTEEWLCWHSLQQGLRSAIVYCQEADSETTARLVFDAIPASAGTNVVRSVDSLNTAVTEDVAAGTKGQYGRLALTPQRIALDEKLVCEIVVDPLRDPFLAEHRFRGRPLMPLVAIVELMTQAGVSIGLFNNRLGMTLEELDVKNGLKFTDDESKSLFVRFETSGERTKATLYYPFADSRGRVIAPERVIATGWLRDVTVSTEPQKLPHLPIAPVHAVGYPGEESIIYHGPPFRCIQSSQYFENGMIATLRAKDAKTLGGERTGEWLTPMGVIDSSLFACGILAWTRDRGSVAIPAGVAAIHIYGQAIPDHVYQGIFSLDDLSAHEGRFSGTILSESGKVLVQMRGYRATLVKSVQP